MMETATHWWHDLRGFAPWLLAEGMLPGATLFALLLLLSQRFVRAGFGDIRQHAFAPDAGKWYLATPVERNWWSCTCVSGACACVAAIARGLRRCCEKVLRRAVLIQRSGKGKFA
jgi:hypothetical protein